MLRTRFSVLMTVLVCCISIPAFSAFVSIDPDAYGDGVDVSDIYSDATLSSVGGYPGLDGRVYAVEDGFASTGTMVFGNNLGFGSQWSADNNLGFALRVDFHQNANSVAIDLIGDDASDSAIVQAYNAQGQLIAEERAYFIGAGQVVRAQLDRPEYDIAYITAGGLTINGQAETIHLDNIEANVIPEPASLLLLGLGAAVLRRRK
ncbi:hypothetical protein STSP2_00716 [Anaerohalosphaera lusitana]|uniref:Ice-binding protein C-terminal domain-containing protein n=1 Tax=Anaerohalosphaera lusitana TaxID=1936003 RepID=A0A1U9NIJ6_9BACT|nr:PEP-CTERM sorting domain-containing protein [Anaerohalosphaera lusitana]AQT67568.1 hypothetical protein STSP2_00716 [Anaerohalosphaera lusitana]